MFPNDAITIKTANDTGADMLGLQILPTGTYTILNIQINSKDIRANTLYCGSDALFVERSTTYITLDSNYLCNGAVSADIYKLGTITFTYVPYNLRLVPASTGNFTLDNGATFTSGDLFISLLLFVGLIIAIIILAIKSIFGVSVHKKYLGVNQIEGKEIYKI